LADIKHQAEIYHALSELKISGNLTHGSCHHFVVKSPWAIDIMFPSEHFDCTNLISYPDQKIFCFFENNWD